MCLIGLSTTSTWILSGFIQAYQFWDVELWLDFLGQYLTAESVNTTSLGNQPENVKMHISVSFGILERNRWYTQIG